MPGKGIGKLISAGAVSRAIVSHIGLNPETQAKMIAGEIDVELVPQGTLVERIRAGGVGLGGVLTATGLGTPVEEETRLGEGLDGIEVVQVLALRPHPNADKIQLVDVDRGDGEALQICCGASNMAVGDKLPLATLGTVMPGMFQTIGRMELARVNLPVGLLIWVMIIPMLVKVDFGALGQVRQHVKGIGVTLVVNWLVKPFTMAFLGWLFIRHLFAPLLPADQLDSYIAERFPRLLSRRVFARVLNMEKLLYTSDGVVSHSFVPRSNVYIVMTTKDQDGQPAGAQLLLPLLHQRQPPRLRQLEVLEHQHERLTPGRGSAHELLERAGGWIGPIQPQVHRPARPLV